MKRESKWEVFVFLGLMGLFLPRLTAADPVIYESGGRRDPFLPLIGPGGTGVKTEKPAEELEIQGIIYDESAESLALINGEFYKPGQRVGSATVISILRDRIILSQDDQEKTLWIRDEILPKGGKKHVEKTRPAKKT